MIAIMGLCIGYFGMSIYPMVSPKTSTYMDYNELPSELKWIIYEFELSAYQHKVDVSKVRHIRYALINNQKWNLGGYYDFITNTLFLNYNDQYKRHPLVIREIMWHELGHGILYYTHDPKDKTTHIMNSGYSTPLAMDWNARKDQFFKEPIKWQFDFKFYRGPLNLATQIYRDNISKN